MKTKKCTGDCRLFKPLSDFHIHNKSSDKHRSVCKECRKKISSKDKKRIAKQQKEYRDKFPWKQTFGKIKQRCNNPKNKKYPRYGGRGIECRITEEEIKFLWFRDKACC